MGHAKGKNKSQSRNGKHSIQEIIDGIIDPLYIINVKDYEIVLANKAACDFGIKTLCTCYAQTHHSGQPCPDIALPCSLKNVVETKKPFISEHTHYDAQGRIRCFEVHCYPLFDENGDVKQVIKHTIDITPRKQIEEAVRESEKRYRNLYQSSRDGYALFSLSGKIKEFNKAFQQMLSYPAQEILPLSHQDITPAHWQAVEEKILQEQVLPLGYSELYEKEYLRKDGTLVPVELRTYLVTNTSGAPSGMWVFARDISERKENERSLAVLRHALEIEKRKLEQVLNIDRTMRSIINLNHLVDFIIEKATEILEVERCSLMLLDQDSKELTIRGALGLDAELITSTRLKIGESLAGSVAREGRPLLVKNIEAQPSVSRTNRSGYKTKSFMIAPISLQKKLIGVVNVADKKDPDEPFFTDIDLRILTTIVRQAATAIETANNYRELEYLSISDPLTGIYNYRHFIRCLDNEIDRSKRYPRPVCLLMLDIDNFKTYNDSFGHLEGDLLLVKISKALKQNLRAVDIVCRYAGDEFVAILPETELGQAKIVAEKIQESIQAIKNLSPVSVSIGVGEHSHSNDRRDLILKTDQALYQAKREGKGRICCFK